MAPSSAPPARPGRPPRGSPRVADRGDPAVPDQHGPGRPGARGHGDHDGVLDDQFHASNPTWRSRPAGRARPRAVRPARSPAAPARLVCAAGAGRRSRAPRPPRRAPRRPRPSPPGRRREHLGGQLDLRRVPAGLRAVLVQHIPRPAEPPGRPAVEVPVLGEAGRGAQRAFLAGAADADRRVRLLDRLGLHRASVSS